MKHKLTALFAVIVIFLSVPRVSIIDLLWWTGGCMWCPAPQQEEGEEVEWGSALDGWC